MVKWYVKHLEETSIADGEKRELKWSVNKHALVKYILIRRADGKSWGASKVTVAIDQEYITDEEAPASLFGTDLENPFPIEHEVKEGYEVKVYLLNKEGETIDVYVDIIYELI